MQSAALQLASRFDTFSPVTGRTRACAGSSNILEFNMHSSGASVIGAWSSAIDAGLRALATGCLCMMLFGCGGAPAQQDLPWQKVGATERDRQKDNQECDSLALATAQTWSQEMRVFNDCMQGRGWRQVPK